MKIRLGKWTALAGLALMTLPGCATYPVAKSLRQQAKPVTLSQAMADPGAWRGTVVIWGGRIIKTANDAKGGSVYILQLPLAHNEKPLAHALPLGRFIAGSKGFLDPELYKRGRLVTVAGTLVGLRTEPVQKVRYNYPVVAIQQIHIWPVEQRYFYYYPAWYWDGWYPDWYWGYYPGWSVGVNWYFFGGDEDDELHGGDWDRDVRGGHWERRSGRDGR
ncbi:MAG: Slp family lipoprotein [Verrucomicrobiota bacterium]|nr:Slp family lipoprotein [Verrucomicrobiota bacterium]